MRKIEGRGCAQSGELMRTMGVGILILLALLFVGGASADTWVSKASVVSGLGDIGSYSAPTVFYKDSQWQLISGEYNGGFYGFTWNGTQWISDSSIVSGLGDVGYDSKPAVFQKDGTWTLISGEMYGAFYGFKWSGSTWVSDSSVVSGLGDIGIRSAPNVFQKDGIWTLIAGEDAGSSYGFTWNGTQWVSNSSYSVGDVGEYSVPTVFQKDGTWTLIIGTYFYWFSGFTWNVTQWEGNSSVVTGLPDDGTRPKPNVFQKDGIWTLIAGEKLGVFYGYTWMLSPEIISWGNNKTNNNTLNLTVSPTDNINFNATANQTITTWNWYKNNTSQSWNYNNFTSNFTEGNHTIKVNATNANGTSNTITWNIVSQEAPSTVTVSCPAAGWCYVASNYSNKTLLQLDNIFSTDTVQGFYDNTTKKYVKHWTGYQFNENKTISQKAGYYYYFSTAQAVTITIPDTHSINLVSGWNLVGNFGANRTLSALSTSITNVTAKQRYNATTKTWVDDDLDTVKQGEGFFAYVNQTTVWEN